MEYSKNLQTLIKNQVTAQAKLNSRIEKEIDKRCEVYRKWYSQQLKLKKRPIAIIAEGDSWMQYLAGTDVVHELSYLLNTEILNLAWPGHEIREIIMPQQIKKLTKELKKGPAIRKKYDYFLFSGGGNDLVGKEIFYLWLHPYKKGMQAKDVINKQILKTKFNAIKYGYEEIIKIRDKYSPKTHMLLNAYDFAIPNGSKLGCWYGPWLKPGLETKKIPLRMRKEVVKLFLMEFNKLLKRIARKHKLVTVVKTQGTITNDRHWVNELHPGKRGFTAIARKFQEAISYKT